MGDDATMFGRLDENDRSFLVRVQQHLPLLADLARADVLLYVPTLDDSAVVVAQAQPNTVPPIYAEALVGERLTPLQDAAVFRTLRRGHVAHHLDTELVRGAPTVQDVYPIVREQRVIGALSVETSLLEHERQRKKSPVFRSAVAQVRSMMLRGQLEGGEQVDRLGEHNGSLVVRHDGAITYVSSIAENLYRKVGLSQSLLHQRIRDLTTDESACFEALETGGCVEQVVQQYRFTWLRRAIPLVATREERWLGRVLGRAREIDGVLIVIEDITDERQKEQELRIKSAMLQEIHHRVKNNLQTIAALLRLQARRTGSLVAAEILQQTINRIVSIAVVHEYLSHDEQSIIALREVGQRIIHEVTQSILDPEKRIRFVCEGDQVTLPAQQATSCALVLNELLQNAVEHAYPARAEGLVRVALHEEGDRLRMEVIDDGQGLPPGFDVERDGSLGLQIVRTLVHDDLKGTFSMAPTAPRGVLATVVFPKHGARYQRGSAADGMAAEAIHPLTGQRWQLVGARSGPPLGAEVARNLL
ncbi:MAG: sensor histidine kinase [Chloroflexi bacterium]|nr:sensor histidine kinase [Chloroflexota bacterium]